MGVSVELMSVKVKLEGFTCADGTPLEPLVRKWAGEGGNAWSWRRGGVLTTASRSTCR
jgi:hypothetical protein